MKKKIMKIKLMMKKKNENKIKDEEKNNENKMNYEEKNNENIINDKEKKNENKINDVEKNENKMNYEEKNNENIINDEEKNNENKINDEEKKEIIENELVVKIKSDNDQKQKSFLENKHSKINKIIMENICVLEYLKNSPKFESLKSFNMKNGKLSDGMFLKNMPNLTELSIKSISNLYIDFLEFLPINIQKLYFEKNNFVNQDFKNIINFYLSKNEKISKNLKCLSFAGNNLTRIDLLSKKYKFEQLIELDFRK